MTVLDMWVFPFYFLQGLNLRLFGFAFGFFGGFFFFETKVTYLATDK